MKAHFTVLFATAWAASADVRYTVVPLLPDDAWIGNSTAGSINHYGGAAGSFLGPFQESVGFVYSDRDGFVRLEGLGNLTLTGINNAGQLAAYDGMGTTYPYRYTPGVGFVNLGTFGGRENETYGINNRGQVVGFSSRSDGSERAFLYADGVGLVDLGTLPGAQHSAAHGINDAGWVVGTSGNRAFLYTEAGGMVDIGPGRGVAINDAGVIVGESSFLPVLYRNGAAIPLVGNGGRANGINNHNVVVGTIDVFGWSRAFIWSEAEGVQDLNALIDSNSGWFLEGAGAINDAGQIVGRGFMAERPGVSVAFRLDPIPEPSTWVLLALGGGLFCLVRCRARDRT